jgi:hypothetical protein
VDTLTFKAGKEIFSHSVVIRVSFAGHTLLKTKLGNGIFTKQAFHIFTKGLLLLHLRRFYNSIGIVNIFHLIPLLTPYQFFLAFILAIKN